MCNGDLNWILDILDTSQSTAKYRNSESMVDSKQKWMKITIFKIMR